MIRHFRDIVLALQQQPGCLVQFVASYSKYTNFNAVKGAFTQNPTHLYIYINGEHVDFLWKAPYVAKYEGKLKPGTLAPSGLIGPVRLEMLK